MMADESGRSIAEVAEILAFYTSVMRGEVEDASMANRISAADKLLGQHMAASAENEALEKLDVLLGEFRCAVMAGEVVDVGEVEDEVDVADECGDVGDEDDEEE